MALLEGVTRTWLFQFVAAVAVQLLMLSQAGATYLLLRWRHRPGTAAAAAAVPPGLVPLDGRRLAENRLLSVVVPAYNEARTLEATLRRVVAAAAAPEDLEVIVVDARGSDGTMAVAERVAAALEREEKAEREVGEADGSAGGGGREGGGGGGEGVELN